MHKTIAITAGVAAVLLCGAQTASASSHVQSPPDGGGTGTVSVSHQYLAACDSQANNRGIRIEYTLDDTTGNEYRLGDGNGADDGCGNRNVGPHFVLSFRVCSSVTGGGDDKCHAWEWIDGR
jgi:opacity protein-like surface antigen